MSVEAPLEDWRGQVPVIGHANQCFIDGRYVDAADGRTFDCISPIDGRHLTAVARGGVEDIDRAVRAARRAFESGAWSRAAPRLRKRVLRRWAQLIRERTSELALIETLDMGKPIGDSSAIDVPATANCIEFYGEAVDKIYDEVAPTAGHVMAMMLREPLGVVGAVVPWNFPMLMAAWKLGPALATGNSVVLKPAEQSPLSALVLAELAAEAGLPDGVLNVVQGFAETGRALVNHPGVAKVSLTGEAETGKLVASEAAKSSLKHVTMELGGKSPLLVFDDADLDNAVSGAMLGNFATQGEVCTNCTRVFVHEDVVDDFLDRLITRTRAIKLGDPSDPSVQMGPLISREHQKVVLDYIETGKREGANLLVGGGAPDDPELADGNYVLPTVFDRCTDEMTIVREEIFGPVMSVLTFRDEAEAIRRANDTPYGLAAGVFTRDLNRAHRCARELQSGICWVNHYNVTPIEMTFGGAKQSGLGRENGRQAIEYYSQLKSVFVATGDCEAPF